MRSYLQTQIAADVREGLKLNHQAVTRLARHLRAALRHLPPAARRTKSACLTLAAAGIAGRPEERGAAGFPEVDRAAIEPVGEPSPPWRST